MMANFEIWEVLKGFNRKTLKFRENLGDFRQFYWIQVSHNPLLQWSYFSHSLGRDLDWQKKQRVMGSLSNVPNFGTFRDVFWHLSEFGTKSRISGLLKPLINIVVWKSLICNFLIRGWKVLIDPHIRVYT